MYSNQAKFTSQQRRDVIAIHDEEYFAGAALWRTGLANISWSTAGKALAYPFRSWEPMTVCKIGWRNGINATHNVDCGIYDSSWNLLVNTGSTVRTGTSSWQWVDVTDTPLSGNGTRYYLTFVEETAGNSEGVGLGSTEGWGRVSFGRLLGIQEMASAFTHTVGLPTTFTPTLYSAAVNHCICAFTIRSSVA